MACMDCLAMFGDGHAAAEHAMAREHLVVIDHRPRARWRADLAARNRSIEAAAARLMGPRPA